MKKCILHIGTVKTGTTKLQGFLSSNRKALADKGIHYSNSMGAANHSALAAHSQDLSKIDDLRMQRGVKNEGDALTLRSNIERLLQEEMEKIEADTVLFSSEHVSSRLQSNEEVTQLKTMLSAFFSDFEIILYLRLQDELALSIYSTQIRNGSVLQFDPEKFKSTSRVLNYSILLERWENVFGKENIKVRLFDKSCFYENSLTSDFLSVIGIKDNSSFIDDGKVSNASYDCVSLETLRRLNKFLPKFVDSRINENRGDIGEVLEKVSVDDVKPMLSKDDAKKILNVFDATNLETFDRYGLGEEYRRLMNDRGGEQSTLPYELNEDELVQVFARAWAYKERLINKNRSNT